MKADLAVEHPGLVPGALLAPEDDGTTRRTGRDWFVDVLWFVLAVGLGALLFNGALQSAAEHTPRALEVLDLVLGVVCCVALWWRRTHVLPVAGLAVVSMVFSAMATMAITLILFSTAIHRRTPTALALAGGLVGGSILFSVIRPQEESTLLTVVVTVSIAAAFLAWGMFVRARRQLVHSLRERAERAETQQRLQGEKARLAERTRIAREMHDVLAHRISLIALHAGGLEVNAALPPEQVRQSAQLLRATAHQALEELRDVIGVLRADQIDELTGRPQPTLTEVPRLVEEVRAAGANVQLQMEVAQAEAASTTLGRDAYRIVQEALTNVAKHARGTATEVQLTGGPGDGLHVRVRNRMPLDALAPQLPGSGTGLLGLQERVGLAGGTLTHAPDGAGYFVVEAQLSWEPA